MREKAPLYLAGAAAVTAVASIVGSEVFLGAALVAALASGRKWRWPAVTAPVVAWMIWTLLSLAVSGHARGGFPQVKKLIWFAMLFVVFQSVRRISEIRGIVLGWAVAAALSAAWGMEQFVRKYHAAKLLNREFYNYYLPSRITGFMAHWMTLSGHMMIALMLIGALLLLSRQPRNKWWLAIAGLLAGLGLLGADVRSMWGGAAAGAIYLLWLRNRWLVAAVPVLAALVLFVNPYKFGDRMISIVRPHGDTDSNEHRAVLRRIGWEMIKAHPLFGVGPEQVGPQHEQYIPADVARPLPTGYYDHLHNIYFHFAAERGLPALAALLWFFGRALYDFGRAVRRLPAESEARWVLHGAIAVIIAFMLGGYFEVNFGDSEVLAMFLATIACGYAAIEAETAS
jgi:putative inorganic carbon (hco3(-)) transporter